MANDMASDNSNESALRIGVLTGGGDCPGLNAVIRAVVMTAVLSYGDSVVGFHDGWKGVLDSRIAELSVEDCRDLLTQGGTILGTSRTNPFALDNGIARVREGLDEAGVNALVAIGGDDTLGVATKLSELGIPVVGVPKTIDNDLSGTELTFGFDTAVQVATEAIDRLKTTAESHHRVIVCEVMGRSAGWIATYAGIAGGVAEIIVPERPFDVREVCQRIVERHTSGQYSSIVVVGEGASLVPGADRDEMERVMQDSARDAFGHARLGGIGSWLAAEIEKRTGFEARVTILGHVQRGGTPTAFDRVLATRFGVAAVRAIHNGAVGQMVALRCGQVVTLPLAEGTKETKFLDMDLYDGVARALLG
ncbi:MAG: 6-phosphofructokinase [Acidimicrobiales bacterium]